MNACKKLVYESFLCEARRDVGNCEFSMLDSLGDCYYRKVDTNPDNPLHFSYCRNKDAHKGAN